MTIQMKTNLLLNFWRKAKEGPVYLSFPDYKTANAFRLRLYVAVRPYRSLDPVFVKQKDGKYIERDSPGLQDIDLHETIAMLEAIALTKADGTGQVVIRPAEMNEELSRLAKEAGLNWKVDPKEAEESLRRIQERLEHPEREEGGVTQPQGYLEIKAHNSKPKPEAVMTEEGAMAGSPEYEAAMMDELQNLSAEDLYGDD